MIFTAGVVGWDEQEHFPSHRSARPVRAGAAQHARDPRRGRRRARAYRAHDLLRHRPRRISVAAATRSAPVWKAIMGAQLSGDGAGRGQRAWSSTRRWSRSRPRRWCPSDRRPLRPRPPAPAGPAAGIPLRPARAAISRAAQRRGRTAQGRRRRTRSPSSTTHGRWTYAELDDFSRPHRAAAGRARKGWSPAIACCCAGPTATCMFAAWLGVLKAGGVVVATMPLLRPGEIATVIERAQISHAIVDSRFIGDFRAGDGADALRQASRQI